MSDKDIAPSHADVTKAELYTYDGSAMWDYTAKITEFTIQQSMNSLRYDGSLVCLDTEGLLETIPLRGEETMKLTIKGHDLGTELNLDVRIYKISNIIPTEANDGALYTLHFMSKAAWNANKSVMVTSYKDDAAIIAKEIFDEYIAELKNEPESGHPKGGSSNRTLPFSTRRYKFKEDESRQFYIQPSSNSIKLTIPRLTPPSALHFVATKAYSSPSPSCTYRFFETLENYYFATDEFFISDVKNDEIVNLFYAPTASNTQEDATAQVNRIDNLKILSNGTDTISDINSGGYRNKIHEIDLVRKTVNLKQPIEFNYDDSKYIDMWGTARKSTDNPHTEQFRNDTFDLDNAKSFIVFKDYQSNGDLSSNLQSDRFLPQIIGNRVAYSHHLNSIVVSASLKGRIDLRPGQVANLDIKTLSGHDGLNPIFSGRYLIQNTSHYRGTDDVLHTTIKLVKFDWSKGSTLEGGE